MTTIVWIGIALCISQSAILSGLNLALFTVSKLRLEMEREQGNPDAVRVAELRSDFNFLLATILWANVSINVLLAQLSGSVLAGVSAFLFSSVLITIVGEILPQAYFSRHALRVAARLRVVVHFYQVLLYPVARPTALVLDRWLGEEAVRYFAEEDLVDLLRIHMETHRTEIDQVEGQGAVNFLALDDLPLREEGEPVDPESVVHLEFKGGRPVFPSLQGTLEDPFLQRIQESGRKWVILSDNSGEPQFVLDSDEFLRDALFGQEPFRPHWHLHRPILIRQDETPLGRVISQLSVDSEHGEDDVIDDDIVLLWGQTRRIITGANILGRLLRGIVRTQGSAGKDFGASGSGDHPQPSSH